jgi:multiple sugar transport system substrate-binding protein
MMSEFSENPSPALKVRTIYFVIVILLGLSACSTGSVLTLTPVETGLESPGRIQESAEPERVKPTLGVQASFTPAPLEIDIRDLQAVDLQFWHLWTQEMESAIQSLVDQFNAENTYEIVVNASSHGDNLSQNLLEGIRTGTFPDIAVGRNFQIQTWDNYRDIIVDLNTYVYNPDWGLSPADIADFYTSRWDQEMFKGKRLGLPAQTSAVVLFYNQSWAQELGFNKPPVTPAEFKDQACSAAANSISTALSSESDTNGIGGWIASTDPAAVMAWMMAFQSDVVHQSGEGYRFDTPEAEDAFAFIKGLFRSGCAWIPGTPYANDEFAARKGLFYSSDITGIPFQLTAFEASDSEDEWIPIPYPGEAGEPVINHYGSAYTILESTPEKQLAAWLFIKWMTQPENQAVIVKTSGHLPTRVSAMNLLDEFARSHPQWSAAQDLLPYSKVEPSFASWMVARWAVSDAVTELVHPDFPSDHIPLLLEDLDALLAEIHDQYR